MSLWNNKKGRGKNMNQIMNVEFLNDDSVNIEYSGKTNHDTKDHFLTSFHDDIYKKGYIVGNDIHRQDVGDFIYYQFYYFDGVNSRNIWFQILKTDLNSIRYIDKILSEIEEAKENELPEIIFEREKME